MDFQRLLVASGVVGSLLLTGATVSYYDESLPSTLNPLYATSMVDHRVHELIYDRLFFRSSVDNRLTSRIVQRYELLDEGRAMKLVLKDGIRWHDGEKLGPDDVCYTVDVLRDPGTGSPVARAWRDALAGCDAVPKENAAIVRFTRAFWEPRDQLGFAVLPKHAASTEPGADFSVRPVGTGAMKAVRGRNIVTFTAYENAHHKAAIDELGLSDGADPLLQVRTLVNGGVHGIVAVAPSYRADVAAVDDAALKSYDLRSWWFVAVNTGDGALADVRVRQALDLTLDREELRRLTIGEVPEDQQSPCEFVSGPFVGSSPYYNRKVPIHATADLAKAKALMEAAGAVQVAGRWTWKGEPITLKIGMQSGLEREAKDLLNQLGNQLQAGGFDRQVFAIKGDDWARTVLPGQATDFDLLVGKWSFGLAEDVGPLFHTRKGEEGALNLLNYSNPEVDALLERFDGASTDTEARDAYHALHAKLATDLPYLFLWKLDTKSAWRNEVRNNAIAPYYYFTDFDAWTHESPLRPLQDGG